MELAPFHGPADLVLGFFLSVGLVAIGSAMVVGFLPLLERWSLRHRPTFPTRWRWFHPVAFVVLYFGVSTALALPPLLLWGEEVLESALAQFLLIAGTGVAVGGAIVGLATQLGGRPGWFGFGGRPSAFDALFGVSAYLVAALWMLGWSGVWGMGLVLADLPLEQEVKLLIEAAPRSQLVPIALCAVVLIPWAEEVFFRGLLFEWLARPRGSGDAGSARVANGPEPEPERPAHEVRSILVSSILFAAVHGVAAFGPILALALVLGYVRARTQGILAPFAIHAVHNGWQVLPLLFLNR